MEAPVDLFKRLAEERGPVALATIVEVRGSSPGKESFKLLVYPDGKTVGTVGGGRLELLVKEEALRALASGKSSLVTYQLTEDGAGMWCGGEVKVFIEPYLPPATVWVFGHGHVACEVVRLLPPLGFMPRVVDDVVASDAGADQWTLSWETLAPFPPIQSGDYVLLLTMDAQRELKILSLLNPIRPRYAGVIGSKRKGERLRNELAALGVNPAVLNLHVPVGLPIRARTAAEIAVSIAAELVQESHGPESAG